MLATAARSMPSSDDSLEEIGRAFFQALDRQGGPAFGVAVLVVLVAFIVAAVRWLQRDTRRERAEREAIEARRLAALAEATPADGEQREWLRIPAALHLKLQQTEGPRKIVYADCTTKNVSAAGISFLSSRPPPPGRPVRFVLDLKEKYPLPLRGIVTRVDPPPVPGGESLVAVKLGPITEGEREQVVRWVTHESTRAVARVRQGKLCPRCGRGLPDDGSEVHATCAARALSHRPSRRPA
jgi:hypothetical protein